MEHKKQCSIKKIITEQNERGANEAEDRNSR